MNFATDAWTSPNQKAFVAITVHFEVLGEAACLILDIVEVAKSHSGRNLAAAFARVLAEFGIEHKVCARLDPPPHTLTAQILSVACDNASHNDTMIDELEELIAAFPSAANRTRCFNHILNLVGRSAVKIFDIPKAKMGEVLSEAERELQELADGIDLEDIITRADEDWDDEGEGDDKDEAEGWVDEHLRLSEADRVELDKSVDPVRRVIVKASATVLFWSCPHTH